MVLRTDPQAEVIVPAVIHWRSGHFAVLVAGEGGRFLIQDPTFREELWVSRRALDDEASGYALVREGPLPAGWRPLSDEEGGRVWGKGATQANDPQSFECRDHQSGGSCTGGSCGAGNCCPTGSAMAVYSFHTMLVSLRVSDSPVGYDPPRGPSVRFSVDYHQREVFQPQIWCTCGSLDKIIDPSGNATSWEYDLLGRVKRDIRPDGSAWEYTYESTSSRLEQRKDPKNQVTAYAYFLDDKLKRITYTGK
jgi:YD repeat-containing protein